MHTVARVLVTAVIVLASLGSGPEARAQSDALAPLTGHWRCSVAGGHPAERSYFALRAIAAPAGAREIFGREDTTERDGSPSSSFERIVVSGAAGGVKLESAEGQGTAPAAALPLRVTGRSFDDQAPFTLTYAVTGDVLQRTATRAGATIDDERCTREPEPPASTTCEHPNVPARTIHAVEPIAPADAAALQLEGSVKVRVVLDDRSRVVWADPISSTSPLLTESSVRAARDSTYQTMIKDCRPVAAWYIFSVAFTRR